MIGYFISVEHGPPQMIQGDFKYQTPHREIKCFQILCQHSTAVCQVHVNICVGLILIFWHRETHITHKGTAKFSWAMRGSISLPSDCNTASCQLSTGCPLTTRLKMNKCYLQRLCVLILNCALALTIYIFVGLILMLCHREVLAPQKYCHSR